MDQILVRSWEDAARTLVHVGWYVGPPEEETMSLGTGVLLSDRLVLTAAHIAEEVKRRGRSVAVMTYEQALPADRTTPYQFRMKSRPTNVDARADRDLCLLTLTESIESGGPRITVPLAAAIPKGGVPRIGDVVDAYGLPPTLLATTAGERITMIFAGMIHMRRHVTDANERGVIVTLPNPHGMSGGPLFTDDGALVGIASATVTRREEMIGPGLARIGFAEYAGVSDLIEGLTRDAS